MIFKLGLKSMLQNWLSDTVWDNFRWQFLYIHDTVVIITDLTTRERDINEESVRLNNFVSQN